MALERELQTYERELPQLLANAGKFVVIQGDKIGGMFDTYEDALRAGYERFGLESFLVKQVQAVETGHSFTREFDPCQM